MKDIGDIYQTSQPMNRKAIDSMTNTQAKEKELASPDKSKKSSNNKSNIIVVGSRRRNYLFQFPYLRKSGSCYEMSSSRSLNINPPNGSLSSVLPFKTLILSPMNIRYGVSFFIVNYLLWLSIVVKIALSSV